MDNTTSTNTQGPTVGLSKATIEELIRLGQTIGDPKQASVNGIPFAVIPQNCKVEDLSRFMHNDYAATPHRMKGTVVVFDAASFVEYWTLFSDENSRAFADESKASVLAVLDYHGAREGGPRWGQHRLTLALRLSEEWKTWTGHNTQAKKFDQADFSEFIENNTPDIIEPKAADMLEMARTLSVKSDVKFQSAIRTNSGQIQMTYTEEVRGSAGKGQLEIPEEFTVSIPVYVGSPRVQMRARLRYRLANGTLSIWYDLFRPEAVQREAFAQAVAQIQGGIASKIINGTPAGN